MNCIQNKNYVKQNLENYLMHKGIDTKKKFRCLNPMHNDRHPSMSYDKNRYKVHCFSCNADYDIFDVIGLDYGLTNTAEIFNKTYELFGITTDDAYNSHSNKKSMHVNFSFTGKHQKQNNLSTIHNIGNNQLHNIEDFQENGFKPDFKDVIENAHKKLLENKKALSYLQSRGLSLEIIKAYKLGYDIKGHNHLLEAYPQHKSNSQKIGLYRYVFPYLEENEKISYFITEISDRSQIDTFNKKYRKINKGINQNQLESQLFNERYLKMQQVPSVIFICEGIYDALSLEQAGAKAIALMGIGHKRLLSICKTFKPNTTFIISLDNDTAGIQSTNKIKDGLNQLNIPFRVQTLQIGKDINEALQIDKKAFTDYVQKVIVDTNKERQITNEQEKDKYIKASAIYQLQNFTDNKKNKRTVCYPTGFHDLDNSLDGGLYAGLYVVGAISSLGKTTFCLQIADNLAATGTDALIFSLEMAKDEILAKSISRHTFLEGMRQYENISYAKTTRETLNCDLCSQKEIEIMDKALFNYSQYAEHIYIHEGIGDIGVAQIRDAIDQHIKIMQQKPVVFIDYLQILAPYNERFTDKQNIDRSVLELKRISRDFAIPVICISSFNRDNYTTEVNMASFKESGTVEYSSDVLIALQYEGMDWQEGENEKERNKRIRTLTAEIISKSKKRKPQNIQVKILKNRNGQRGETLMNFYPMFNYFEEKAQNTQINENWITTVSTDCCLDY